MNAFLMFSSLLKTNSAYVVTMFYFSALFGNDFDIKLTGDDFINLRSRLEASESIGAGSRSRSVSRGSKPFSQDLVHSIMNAVSVALKKRQMQLKVC